MQAAGFSPAAARADPISRRDKSLGLLYEARLRGLPQATKVAFVLRAKGFSPMARAARADPISRRDKSLGLLYEARLRGLPQAA